MRELGRFSGLGYLAVKKAIEYAKIRPSDQHISTIPTHIQSFDHFPSNHFPFDPLRTGVIMGSGIGSLQDIANTDRTLLNEDRGYRKVTPYFIPKILINLSSGLVSKKLGTKGPIGAAVLACATGSDVISQAFHYIKNDYADVMFVGASEDSMNHLTICGFSRMRALAINEDATKACRPFDKKRNGFVIGEGAGALVIEDFEHALKRGANILAEIRSIGNAGEGYHWSRPSPDAIGATLSMKSSLHYAGLEPVHIDYINAHATSTPAGDEIENKAMKLVFGEHAKNISISSTKGAVGHMLGASGIVESIISILAIQRGQLPPTLNIEELEDDMTLNYVPNVFQTRNVNVVMNNSFGFGGVNTSIIFSRMPPDADLYEQ